MIERGWTDPEIRDLMGGNLMRVMDQVDAVAESLRNELPSVAIWEKRTDLPAKWGGEGDAYYPHAVKAAQAKLFAVHDEL
jgi:membrane dipeptidase